MFHLLAVIVLLFSFNAALLSPQGALLWAKVVAKIAKDYQTRKTFNFIIKAVREFIWTALTFRVLLTGTIVKIHVVTHTKALLLIGVRCCCLRLGSGIFPGKSLLNFSMHQYS